MSNERKASTLLTHRLRRSVREDKSYRSKDVTDINQSYSDDSNGKESTSASSSWWQWKYNIISYFPIFWLKVRIARQYAKYKTNKNHKTLLLALMLVLLATYQGFGRSRLTSRMQYRYTFPEPIILIPDEVSSGSSVMYGCSDERNIDQIQIHVLGWRREKSLQSLLMQLQNANYSGWDQTIPLYLHLDGGCNIKTQNVVHNFAWKHGHKFVKIQKKNIGLRNMWLKSLRPVAVQSNNTLLVVFEDDMRVSGAYFQWLLAVIEAYGRHPSCRDANLVGFSLSPIKMDEMHVPFTRWRANTVIPRNDDAFLVSLPSSWGAAYWSDRWKEFDDFAMLRMQEPFYNTSAEENVQEANYDNLHLTPKELYIPDSRSNVWPKSWKRFMIDFMYARGLVMLYPNLPREQALATTIALRGEHANNTSLRYKNPRVAELVETIDLPHNLTRYGDLTVLNLRLQSTSREQLAAEGTSFLAAIIQQCKRCDELVNLWKRPETDFSNVDRYGVPRICAIDLYVSAAAKRPQSLSLKKYLVYEPQYGANNQFFAMVNAYFWARALGRHLVLPPVFVPRVSAYVGNKTNVETWLSAKDIFQISSSGTQSIDVHSTESSALWAVNGLFSKAAVEPIDFFDFYLKKEFLPWRIVRTARDAVFDEPSHLMAQTLHPGKQLEVINLRHLFDRPQVTVKDVEHLLGGCTDDVLLFDGMFFSKLLGVNARMLMPHVLSLNARNAALYSKVKAEVVEKLGTPKYGCFHFRQGDFVSMCRTIESNSTFRSFKAISSSSKTAETFTCGVTLEELRQSVQSFGSPAFIMSDNATAVQLVLSELPLATVTSDWVRSSLQKFLPQPSSRKRLELLSLLIEEQICADASFSVVNRFSTVSQRVISLRRCSNFWYWRKDLHLKWRSAPSYDSFYCKGDWLLTELRDWMLD